MKILLNTNEILSWLLEEDEKQLEILWNMASEIRRKNVGDEVHLRGLLEISNYCVRSCAYCGINSKNTDIERYRMSAKEILEGAKLASQLNYGTIVLQSGEDYGIKTHDLSHIIKEIKEKTPLAVTLSLGERPYEDLKEWKKAGADRYLLRFETSDPKLYSSIHPSVKKDETPKNRFVILKKLRELGYEIGSGVMIGIPGQTYETLAQDIRLFGELDLDMIGVGPYIMHPKTDLGKIKKKDLKNQVPNSESMTYKVIALSRILCPQANIPSTTALATLNKTNGRELALLRGANVVMPNITPVKYRAKYEIYPEKACLNEAAEKCNLCLQKRIESIGRKIGKNQGGRKRCPEFY